MDNQREQDEPPSTFVGRIVFAVGVCLGLRIDGLLPLYCAAQGGFRVPIEYVDNCHEFVGNCGDCGEQAN